jgi:gliding motility-associated-like protein
MKLFRYSILLILFLATSFLSLSAQELSIINVSTTPTSCSDAADGTISFEITGGTAPYNWSVFQGVFPVDFGSTPTAGVIVSTGRTKSNIYLIGVQDDNEEVVYMAASVGGPGPMQITSYMSADISCNSVNDGTITVTATGESDSPLYDLTGPVSQGNSTGIFTMLPGGVYTVTVRDGGICTTTDATPPLTIVNPPVLDVTIDLVTNVNCNGESTGAIEITTSGGTPGYSFFWTGPNGFTATTEDISGLAVGDYSLSITDANSCNRVFPDLVTITENLPIAVSFITTDLTCGMPLPSNDGAIDATVSGGSPGYSFSWTGPYGFTAATEDISGLGSGSYELTVTDNLGCIEVTAPQAVASPLPLTATATQVDITCFGDADGSIDLTVAGGTTPYSFAWTGPSGYSATTEDISGLEAGAYSVAVTYSSICSVPFTDIATITEPPEIQVSSVKTDISCGGLSDGAIDITVSGGLPPYQFAWTGPSGFTSTDEDLSGLAAGSYSLTITDGYNCMVSFPDQETIIEPSSVVASYISHQDVSCNGDASGSIEIDVTGGIAPYIFEWTNSSGTPVSGVEDPAGLPADSYSLTITDANGCMFGFPDLATITEPPPLTASLNKTDVTCFGAGDGTITVTAAGGAAPYEYSSDGITYQGAAAIGPLIPGSYTIWTRDANSCMVTDTITILEPLEIMIQNETANYLCHGSLQGDISINGVSGGVAPYMYSINGGTDFYSSNLFTALAPGSYQTVVMDATGCSINGNLNILTEPPQIQVATYSQVDITSCSDSNEGSILVTGTGGTGTITYSLDGDPPVAVGDFQNLPGGNHIITLMDDNGCTYDTTVLILTPPALSIDNITITDVTGCGGNTNGRLVVTGSGGTPPREFSLDDVTYQSSGTFNGLAAGDYTVWLRDANGCSVTSPASISEPEPVMATVIKTDLSYGNLGSIDITNVTGGTAPYEYSIHGLAGPFTGTTLYTDLSPASYDVIVRDQNGCTYEETVQILDIPPLDVLVNITQITCFGADDGIIELVPQDAQGAVQYSIDDGVNFQSGSLFENLPGDSTYLLVVLDEAGKLFTGAVTLTDPAEILYSESVTPALCNAFSETGAINITVSGGSGSFTYLWSDGETSEDRSNILAGVYDLVITDGYNCVLNESITVSSEVTVNADAGEDAIICPGTIIQLQGAGVGTPAWDPSPFLSDTSILDPVAAGMTEPATFILTITESMSGYGCYNKDSVTVDLFPESGDLYVTKDTFVIEGHSIQIEAFGGPFDQYRWEPEAGLDINTIPNPTATPTEPTWYYIFAQNEYGCEEIDSVFIDVIEDIQAYNAFSPNGDGINEYFEIRNSERFPEMLVEIYSRWGEQLYSTIGYGTGSQWDGTAKGKDVPVGTYYYIIVPYPGAKPISGNVTIIR